MKARTSCPRPPRQPRKPMRPPTDGRRAQRVFVAALLWLALLAAVPLPAAAQDAASPLATPDAITAAGAFPTDARPDDAPFVTEAPTGGEAGSAAWLEPRGLGIYDMVGAVPEAHLRGSIIVNLPGNGLLLYESGSRSGNNVEINARVIPSYFTYGSSVYTRVSCLGQVATYDTWPVTSPASRAEIFANGAPVHQTTRHINYYPAGHRQPVNGAGSFYRYAKVQVAPSFAADGSLSLPPNLGCSIVVEGKRTNVTARFRLTLPPRVQIAALGSETFAAQSYIGPGSAGILSSLSRQMGGRYGNRAPAFDLHPPSGTDYVYVHFPPTPVDPYPGEQINYGQPGGGTYRFERRGGGLSVDRISSMGIPLHGHWQDADQAGGSYLPHFGNPPRMATPEYFLPPGVPYDSCMTNGGCSGALLDRIYNTTFNVTVYYYQVRRTAAGGLSRIPLRQVGRSWSTAAAAEEAAATAAVQAEPALMPDGTTVEEFAAAAVAKSYLPLVTAQRTTPEPPEDRAGCPCGWFDADGAMVDFIPPP